MKKLLILIITICCWSNTNAQSHDMSPGSTCKLIKTSVNSESAVCPACAAKDKKEKDAKLAENNRRAKVISDKAKADKIASDNAWKAKQLEDAKNTHSGEVLINGNNNVAIESTIPNKKEEINTYKKNYFYSVDITKNSNDLMYYFGRHSNGFIVNNDTILNNHEFRSCSGIARIPLKYQPENNKYNFPPNIGIVILNEEKISPPRNGREVAKNVLISDLVDIKGTRILNDKNITAIIHFADDYFILLKGEYFGWGGDYYVPDGYFFDDASIYNIKTKISHPIQKKETDGRRVSVSIGTNRTIGFYKVRDELLLSKETYKAFFLTETNFREFIVYYITNEGAIKEQKINNN